VDGQAKYIRCNIINMTELHLYQKKCANAVDGALVRTLCSGPGLRIALGLCLQRQPILTPVFRLQLGTADTMNTTTALERSRGPPRLPQQLNWADVPVLAGPCPAEHDARGRIGRDEPPQALVASKARQGKTTGNSDGHHV
jgi:hypothetical protein